MFPFPAFFYSSRFWLRRLKCWLIIFGTSAIFSPANAVILWNDPDTTLVHEAGAGVDILSGAVKRDDSANDTLYFKFHVVPLSDKDTEEYFAGFELFEGDAERLGIGNSMKAWAYSAFFHADETGESNNLAGYIDLHTLKPETTTDGNSGSYQYPRRGVDATIVFKVQYIPGEDDLVTVWLNPDLGPGANEAYQPDGLTTRFNANASFDEIRLRHAGGGGGWAFNNLAIATAFSDFVDGSSARPNDETSEVIGGARAFNFQSWQKEQGLPQSPVRALCQTHDGYLWVGSDDGVARFDGLRFVSFGIQEGIKSGPVTALCEDSRGTLWIGSADNGLSSFQNGQVITLTRQNGLPTNSITALAEDSTGRLWIGTEAGLVLEQDGRLVTLAAANEFKGRQITLLLKDRQGRMWLGAQGAGIFQYIDGKFISFEGNSVADSLKDSHCLLIDQKDRRWIGAGINSVLCDDHGHWHHYSIPHDLARSHISTLAEESDGTIWAGSTDGGLLQFTRGQFVSIPEKSGLAGNQVESLLTDREGRLWVGTDAGLNRLRRKSLFVLSQSEGLGFGAAQGMAEVAPGIVWVTKPNDGLYRWNGKSFSRLSAAGLASHDSQINTLLITRDGFCWVATTNNLLLYKDPVAADDEVEIIKPPAPDIISLAEDRTGSLWIGTREGKIRQLDEGQWRAPMNFSQTNAITAILPDADGSLWIGTDGNGLFRFNNGSFQHMDKSNGLLSDALRTLYFDAQGSLWIGAGGEGLSRWQNGKIENFTTHEGLPNDISQIMEDNADRLWFGTSEGIACVNKKQLDELAAGKISMLYPRHFGRAEGMLSEECTGGFFPAGLKTKSGLLWFSTLKGVVVIDPKVQPAVALMPNTVLEEILIDGVPVSMPYLSEPKTGRLRIMPGKHRVEFRYTGFNFDAPESIRFRYRLEGLDTDWVEAGTRRAAFYSYLPPGNYRFRVEACNSDGTWTNSAAELNLIVLRHFWQNWWFITLIGLSILIFVGGAVRMMEKRRLQWRLKRLEQERALERERTRIAQDLHDEMGAKLCRISYLSEHARRGELAPEELQDQIASISDASREVLHSLDEIVWAVNPQNDTLEHLASYIGQYAQDYFQMTGIQCELDIPTQLPPHPLSSQVRHHLFLATHEALTNILKHSKATRAKISIISSNAAFEINILDNGNGFNSSVVQSRSEFPAVPTGDGLNNMCRRLTDIGGNCLIESTPGQRTKIRFIVPLNLITNKIK